LSAQTSVWQHHGCEIGISALLILHTAVARSKKTIAADGMRVCVCVSGHVWAYLGVVPGKLQDNFATCWGGEKPEEAVLLCFQLIYPMSMPHF